MARSRSRTDDGSAPSRYCSSTGESGATSGRRCSTACSSATPVRSILTSKSTLSVATGSTSASGHSKSAVLSSAASDDSIASCGSSDLACVMASSAIISLVRRSDLSESRSGSSVTYCVAKNGCASASSADMRLAGALWHSAPTSDASALSFILGSATLSLGAARVGTVCPVHMSSSMPNE